MNPLDERLARIVALHRETSGQGAETSATREHRLARQRVTQDLPRFAAVLHSVADDLNERLTGSGLQLRLSSQGHTPIAEALFVVSLCSHGEESLKLRLGIDGSGQLSAVVPDRGARPLPAPPSLFDCTKDNLTELFVDFLEVEYH